LKLLYDVSNEDSAQIESIGISPIQGDAATMLFIARRFAPHGCLGLGLRAFDGEQ
jgi:hypothetical protein